MFFKKMDDETSVRVALRIRPQVAREKIEMCRVCTEVTPGEPQVVLGSDKAFTFDYVFDMDTVQESIYDTCVRQLLEGCFDGYNATILAYGQTGSGKTYTMGTGFDVATLLNCQGIIPRAVKHLFDGIQRRKMEAVEKGLAEPCFQVNVQFIELYKEEILDLLDTTRDVEASRTCKSNIKIHEDYQGNIYMAGVVNQPVNSADETMAVLRGGALTRTTGKTDMNAESSRSHAIFTIYVNQQRFIKQDDCNGHAVGSEEPAFEMLKAKFHFVDLAGSERLKRTRATGIRAEEGININCGLLALGNVISALGDLSRKVGHVPYRDSKLTRLLQDSLGGNSRTIMIACISPSDCDFVETLNTLKYANRARNIKNKVVINQDKSSRVISELRARVQALEVELAEYKQGRRIVTAEGGDAVNDVYNENVLLLTELNQLRLRVKALQESQDVLRARNADILCEMEARKLRSRSVAEKDGNVQETGDIGNAGEDDDQQFKLLIKTYLEEIENLRTRLCESEAAGELLRQQIIRYKATVQNQQRFRPSLDGSVPAFGTVSSSPCMATSVNGGTSHAGGDDLTGSLSPLVAAAKADIERLKIKSKELESGPRNGECRHDAANRIEISDKETAEENSEESDSDEPEEECGQFRQELADLQCEISLKERLVEELVQSQKRLQAVRLQYEEKLTQLQMRIQDTELERDRVLTALENKQKTADDNSTSNTAKVRQEYEERLISLRNEMKRLQAAQKEHQRLNRELQQNQTRIHSLSNELQEMKKTKVQLMRKIKEESTKSRMIEMKSQKELAQLQKEARRRENELREFKIKDQRREAVLRRKQEELQNLRAAQRPVSIRSRPAGQKESQIGSIRNEKVGNSKVTVENGATKLAKTQRRSDRFLSRMAKHHWSNVEKSILNQIAKKQTMSRIEQDLERFMKSRDEKRKQLENLIMKRRNIVSSAGNDQSAIMGKSYLADIDDQVDAVQANIDYLQEQITDCQKQIMDVEESAKDEPESPETNAALFENCQRLDEAKYLLEHLYNFCIMQGSLAAEKHASLQETEMKLDRTQQEFKVHQKLLEHLISNNPVACGLSENMASSVESMSGSLSLPTALLSSNSLAQSYTDEKTSDNYVVPPSMVQPMQDRMAREKARRRTATPEELLYSSSSQDPIRPTLGVVFELDDPNEETNSKVIDGSRTRDCSPENVGRAHASKGSLDRSFSCTDVEDRLVNLLPPVPPRKHPLSEYPALSRSNGLKRRDMGHSAEESHEILTPTPALMTVSDSLVTLRPALTSVQTSTVKPDQQHTGSTSSLTVGTFSRGHPNRSTIAVSDNLASRNFYGSRNHASKTGAADSHMRKIPSAVITSSSSIAGSSCPVVAVHPFTNTTTAIGTGLPPTSPRVLRRQLGSMNVFSRLTNTGNAAQPDDMAESDSHSQGILFPFEPKKQFRNNVLRCVYVAEGHSKAVLTVAASDSIMATGSKDRTVKIWDLEKGVEILTLANHPNNVQCVRLDPTENLLFSVSMGQIKVWDVRSRSCLKTLSSSGLTGDGDCFPAGGFGNKITDNNRQTTLGNGEAMIAQIDFTPTSGHLLVAAYNQIQIWDLRNCSIIGKMSNATSTPKSEVSCMNVVPSVSGFQVAAGSRDHYIKVFDITSSAQLNGSVESCMQLDPPHYDGVTCLSSYNGRWLFSGSRDQCLVKWDLHTGQRVQPITKAHSDWILSLCFLPPPFGSYLVSCCRNGRMQLWDGNTCTSLGQFVAHGSAINCLSTNRKYVFTAASDNTVGIWEPKEDILSPPIDDA